MQKGSKVVTLIAGISLALAGLLGAIVYTVLVALQRFRQASLVRNLDLLFGLSQDKARDQLYPLLLGQSELRFIAIATIAAIALVLGAIIAYHAWASLRGRPSTPFRPSLTWLLSTIAVFTFVLVGGQMILGASFETSFLFPPFHFLAGVLPVFALLTLAGARLKASTWRQVSLQLSYGTIIAPILGIVLELALLLFVVVIIALIIALMPGGTETLRNWMRELENPGPLLLSRLLTSPLVLLLVIAIISLGVPMIEELAKSLGVVLLAYHRPSRNAMVLWGLACGAGFALTEGLLSQFLSASFWGLGMTMRVFTVVLHATTTGLMGLGWYYALITRRPLRLLGTYAGAIGIHGLWNGAAVLVAVMGFGMVLNSGNLARITALALATMLSISVWGLVGIIVVVLFFYLTRNIPELQ